MARSILDFNIPRSELIYHLTNKKIELVLILSNIICCLFYAYSNYMDAESFSKVFSISFEKKQEHFKIQNSIECF